MKFKIIAVLLMVVCSSAFLYAQDKTSTSSNQEIKNLKKELEDFLKKKP